MQLQRERAITAQLRGLASVNGPLAPDADTEAIAKGAHSTIEALTRHLAEVFLKSENVRGLGEAYTKLLQPFLGMSDEDGGEVISVDSMRGLLTSIADAARAVQK